MCGRVFWVMLYCVDLCYCILEVWWLEYLNLVWGTNQKCDTIGIAPHSVVGLPSDRRDKEATKGVEPGSVIEPSGIL